MKYSLDKIFGSYKIIEISKNYNKVICLCTCGTKKEIWKSNLGSGKGLRCRNCYKKEAPNESKTITHGETRGYKNTQFYNKYRSMKGRCSDIKEVHYGLKGILCSWSSFLEFKKDMYPSYLRHVSMFGKMDTTLDRIDNSNGYCVENCRWATTKEQQNNRTNNRKFLYKGEYLGIPELSALLGIKYATLYKRLVINKKTLNF